MLMNSVGEIALQRTLKVLVPEAYSSDMSTSAEPSLSKTTLVYWTLSFKSSDSLSPLFFRSCLLVFSEATSKQSITSSQVR